MKIARFPVALKSYRQSFFKLPHLQPAEASEIANHGVVMKRPPGVFSGGDTAGEIIYRNCQPDFAGSVRLAGDTHSEFSVLRFE